MVIRAIEAQLVVKIQIESKKAHFWWLTPVHRLAHGEYTHLIPIRYVISGCLRVLSSVTFTFSACNDLPETVQLAEI